ncbi:hypothetical protein NLG97_g100 [Lecanicillium saksenae]|uniref:Uncharacterized protein n=1 Tax=Lecanicillium saksenae TaxID=468837 RepID=A0ACC1R7J6_9HYPO|nr:hypothetical protein NLG97_g100 [Lecanicillium saksenae]
MLRKLKNGWRRETDVGVESGVKGNSSVEAAALKTVKCPENLDIAFPDGVKTLHDSPDAAVDICFIHGLTGNRDSTWTAKGQDTPWPTLLLETIPSARLLTYGYNAYFTKKAHISPSTNRLLDHATNFLLDLTNDRAASKRVARPLMIVAHSMGGLVCKQALLLSLNHPNIYFHDVIDSLKGIVFMGTPHRGSWMANWGITPASALSIFRPTNTSLLDVLGTENLFLEAIHDQFLSLLQRQMEHGMAIEITCFFEELPSFRSLTIVPKVSAILEGYGHYSIHANHAEMVKFATAEDTGFKRVSGELLRWASSITAPTPRARQRRRRTFQSAFRLQNIKAGKGSTQVLEADRLNAEGITAGDHSFQILSPDARKIMTTLQLASIPGAEEELLREEVKEGSETDEMIMVPASSSMARK